ncbi:hypothetical protein [Pseudomonas sp. R76]|uniref:hypothetical protein n=1 Tax=Pseudomonas sp. R76 TaxID=1573711 RepID=UPI00131FD1C7|nr:hypothetical protein [Pseudomonas sp. R76]QHD07393.1 hypothetical protein PspR76_17380 [Pseudomonas sp. R76]
MDRTNRAIIDSFVERDPGFYIPEAYNPGTLAGEVPGYRGLLTRTASRSQSTLLNVELWVNADVGQIIEVQIVPFVNLDTLPPPPEPAKDPDEKEKEDDPTVPPPPELTAEQKIEAAENHYFDSNGWTYRREVTSLTDPIQVDIPQGFRPPGLYLLRYKVREPNASSSNKSVPQLLIVDETSPYDQPRINPPRPRLPLELPAGATLDEAFFRTQDNNMVFFPIPYTEAQGYAPGDKWEGFFGSSDEPYAIGTQTQHEFDASRGPGIWLPWDVVLAESGGVYTLTYKLYDAGLNPSERSLSLNLNSLAQSPVPTEFKAPLVALAVPGDGLIDRADVVAQRGTTMEILNIPNALATDIIDLQLISTSFTPPITLSRSTPVGTGRFITFDSDAMDTLYGGRAVGKNRVRIVASYVLRRGTNTYPAAALETPFDLDLSVPGPNPTGPGPLNTNLPLAIVRPVRPASDTAPITDNHLEERDAGRDAIARIPYWTGPVSPADSLPYRITLHFAGKHYSLTVTTISTLGYDPIRIPFNDIKAAGGPSQIAYYTITSAASANPQDSGPTTVKVDSVIMQMDPPVVLGYSGTPATLTCDSLIPPNTGRLRVHISGSDYLVTGNTVSVRYQGFANGVSVVDVTKDFVVPDTVAARNGWDVTFEESSVALFNPLTPNRGSTATGSATVTASTVYQGQTVPSRPATYRVRGYKGATSRVNYCEGLAMPPAPTTP